MKFFPLVLLVVSLSFPAFAAEAPAADQTGGSDPLISHPSEMQPPDEDTGKTMMVIPSAPPSASKMGILTGGTCGRDKDCVLGCAPKSQTITCLDTKEGSDMCLKDRFYIPPEESCGCLEDLHRCGFLGHNAPHH